MDQKQFIKGFTFLSLAYNKDFDEQQCGVWYDFFKDTDYEAFRTAVKRIITKNKFMPSIAEIKQEVALISNPVLQLKADEEWDEVIKAIRKYGSYREKEAMDSLKPYTRYIARQVGYQRICMSEEIQWERKEFIELFNNSQDRDETALMLNEPQMTLSEIMRIASLKEKELLEHKDQKLIG